MPEHGISSETPLWHASTLSGIISILSSLYHTNTFYENVQGIVATSSNNGLIYQWQNPDVHGACSSFYDPLEYVVQKYQEMMFRSGAYFGQEFEPTSLWKAALDANQNAHQVVTGNILGHHDAFHTNYAFFATALAIEIACIAIILTTYWGWWRLGCPVSFSPVEIAKVSSRRLTYQVDKTTDAGLYRALRHHSSPVVIRTFRQTVLRKPLVICRCNMEPLDQLSCEIISVLSNLGK